MVVSGTVKPNATESPRIRRCWEIVCDWWTTCSRHGDDSHNARSEVAIQDDSYNADTFTGDIFGFWLFRETTGQACLAKVVINVGQPRGCTKGQRRLEASFARETLFGKRML